MTEGTKKKGKSWEIEKQVKPRLSPAYHQEARNVGVHEIPRAAAVGSNDRLGGAPGLQYNYAKGLVPRWHHDGVAGLEQRMQSPASHLSHKTN